MSTATKSKERKRSIPQVEVVLPSYNAGERVGPPTIKPVPPDCSAAVQPAQLKNFAYCVTRQINVMDQNVLEWTRFNILTRNQTNVNQDTIGYLPTINAPATALSTVNKILTQALKIKESLDLKEIVRVFDQARYAKAADIAWKHRGKLQSVVLRMGVFHTICNFLGIIGKRFLDAGLRDVAVESEIIMEGSVDRVLSGHYYNRGIRLHKLVYEVLQRLIWKSFLSWFEQNLAVESQSLLHDSHLLLVDLNQLVTQENLDA